MGTVLWHVTMSVDGYIAGPDHAMDWVFRWAGPNAEIDSVIHGTGAILAGRNSYDVGRRPGQQPEAREAFGGEWSGPQFVLTNRPPPGDDTATTFLSGDIGAAVRTALDAARGRDLLIIGADVARQCVEAGLVDELLVHVAPILLGDGVRLFQRVGSPVDLNPFSVTIAGQITNLRFRLAH